MLCRWRFACVATAFHMRAGRRTRLVERRIVPAGYGACVPCNACPSTVPPLQRHNKELEELLRGRDLRLIIETEDFPITGHGHRLPAFAMCYSEPMQMQEDWSFPGVAILARGVCSTDACVPARLWSPSPLGSCQNIHKTRSPHSTAVHRQTQHRHPHPGLYVQVLPRGTVLQHLLARCCRVAQPPGGAGGLGPA